MPNNPHHPHEPSGSGNNKSAIAIAAVGATVSGVAAAVTLSKVVAPRTGAGYVKRSLKKLNEAQELTYKKREEGPPDEFIIPLEGRNKLMNEQLIPLQNDLKRLQGLTKTFVGSAWNWSDSQDLYRASDHALGEVQRISGEAALAYRKEQDDKRLQEQRQNQSLHHTNSGPSGHQQETSNYYGPTSSSHRNHYSSMSTDPAEDSEIQEERKGSSSSQIPSRSNNPVGPPLSIASNSYDSHGQPSSDLYGYPPRNGDQTQSSESSQPRNASIRTSHSQTTGYNAHNPPLGDREQAQFSESSQPHSASIRTSHSQTTGYNTQNLALGDKEQTQKSESHPQARSAREPYYERHGQTSPVQVRPHRDIEHDRASKASSGSGGSEYYSVPSYQSNTSNVSEYSSARSYHSNTSKASGHSASQHATSQRSSTANFHQYPANNFQGPGPSYDNNAQNYEAYYTQGQDPANHQHSTHSNTSQSSSASKKSRSAAAKKQD